MQRHHIAYNPREVIVYVFRFEHLILTLLNRISKSKPSKSFVELVGAWYKKEHEKVLKVNGSYKEREMRSLWRERRLKQTRLKQKYKK